MRKTKSFVPRWKREEEIEKRKKEDHDRRVKRLATAPADPTPRAWDGDPDLEKLKYEINKEHQEVLTTFRKSLEHALRIGALLDAVKQKLGHGLFGWWMKKHCQFSLSTAKLYHRLFRRLNQMPDMRSKIIDLDLNGADAVLKGEWEEPAFV
jgi:hypothetical protein